MNKRRLISIILGLAIVVGSVMIFSNKAAAYSDDDTSGDLLIGTDLEEYMIPIIQEYDESDLTAYGDKEELDDLDKEDKFDDSHDDLYVELPDDYDVKYYFWGDSPSVPYRLVILTDDLEEDYLVRLYRDKEQKWDILDVKDNGNGTATVDVTDIGPVAIYVPVSYVSYQYVEEEYELEDDEKVKSVEAGERSRTGSRTKALPTVVQGTGTANLDTMMVPYGAYEDLSVDDWGVFKTGYNTLKTAIPDGMLARFFFWCSSETTPYEIKFTMEDVNIKEDVVVKVYKDGEWLEMETVNNGGGTITTTFTENGPVSIFTEKR